MEKSSFPKDFDAIKISIASPDDIRSWSHGEITKPETINYRTFKPERDGLFCAKIFGPINDWECLCGKYKRMKHQGVICDKCGVEVTRAKVRRERLGHIELACPVSHIWFFKGLPSRIANILDISVSNLESVLYYESYIVVEPGNTPLKEKQLLSDEEYRELKKEYGNRFIAKMGAEGIRDLLLKVDVEKLAVVLRKKMKDATSVQKKLKYAKRLKVIEAFRKSENKPEWMILEVIPVIPPELRPLVPLDGGRFATSDLNDLYRRVINRNNRLKKLIELKAPDVIIRNEKRMLQEAVDSLLDNGRRGRVLRGANNRPLKSLSDALKGKQGRFRQNLLGKRVDYSGRSVIVVGPELKLHQCGLPKKMALELFKPFIYHRLEKKGYVSTIKAAKEMVEQEKDEVWDILEEVIKDHPVLLNRAPTLHRLGIQAFQPILIEGKAIKIHPLVCAAFNADFDGDQMAVHVPLSPMAQIESSILMLSSNNLLSPAHGGPIAIPSQDIVLGLYYLTQTLPSLQGNGKIFNSMEDVLLAHQAGDINIFSRIKLRYSGELIDLEHSWRSRELINALIEQCDKKLIDTTVGRVIFNDALPSPFPYVNGVLKKKGLGDLVSFCYLKFGKDITVKMLDKLKELGFLYATKAGISIGVDDMLIPPSKDQLVKKARSEVISVDRQYKEGVITNGERYNKIIAIWSDTTDKITEEMFSEMSKVDKTSGKINPLFLMADSGARGSKQQIRQIAAMRGLMAKPSGEIIETPITSNFREGLTVLQYFISTHGARKGLADTALKTADSGYLTRRLVDVVQDVIVTMGDCKTLDGIEVKAIVEGGEIIESLRDRIIGRIALDDIKDPFTGEIIVSKNQEITEEHANMIENSGIDRIKIRSVLTCKAKRGVCIKCYGRNLARGKMVELGEAVGVIAAQSIGEPGTQLTMRTFHIGGTASRVAERSQLEAVHNGIVKFLNLSTVKNKDGDLIAVNRNGSIIIQDQNGREKERYSIVYGARLKVENGEAIKAGTPFVEWDPFAFTILTESDGRIEFKDVIPAETMKEEVDEITGLSARVIVDSQDEKIQPQIIIKDENNKEIRSYFLPSRAHLVAEDGQLVYAGDTLAKMPRETTKTKDITGGLPRVVELFEARKPKQPAVITEIDGITKYGGVRKGMRKIYVVNDDGEQREYHLPKGVHINVQEGERVRAGEPLNDGPVNPHDILNVLGEKALQNYLVNEIQEVYRLQGVSINDKHIEVIVRQMMRWVKVEEVGDTEFLVDQQVDKFHFQEENERIIKEGGKPATGRPLLLGITKASLSIDSWISAASFQETTRVLTEASVSAKIDTLRGLKENVIVGRLIPAGTGMEHYRNVDIIDEEVEEEEEKIEEVIEEGEKEPVEKAIIEKEQVK
jgi:DNA-directed RNA polymerase subunit beta'